MLAHIAHAHGSPSPTLVLSAERLPTGEEELTEALTEGMAWLAERGLEKVTKIALVALSEHPLFDLDYRFVQVIPGDPVRLDFRGSCGHSVLSSVEVASRLGWISRLAPEQRTRVRVLNNDEHVVCEVDECVRERTTFTAHFLNHPSVPLGDLLPFGETVTDLPYARGVIRSSAVSVGNPYIFLNAADLGAPDTDALFAADRELLETMVAIRRSAARQYGWPVEGAFPKVAAVLADGPGALAVRAVSVPSWHPTIALTGAVCIGAASQIRGTIPFDLAGGEDQPPGPLQIHTPGGFTTSAPAVSGIEQHHTLSWVSVPEKTVTFSGALTIEPLASHTVEEESCLLSTP